MVRMLSGEFVFLLSSPSFHMFVSMNAVKQLDPLANVPETIHQKFGKSKLNLLVLSVRFSPLSLRGSLE
jgi:hypothetical protein